MLLIGLSVALWFGLRANEAPPAAVRAAVVLLVAEAGQALIGWTQYFTDLPVALVAAHLAGACLVLIAACRVVLATRERGPLADVALPRSSDALTAV
jgi:cytochrome c oxidase assembly protein subunit 15